VSPRILKERPIQSEDGSAIPAAHAESIYNAEDFFVPVSAGPEDLAVTQSFRCTAKTDRQIDIILASRKFNYISRGDLLRHSLHRHLAWLLKIEPEVVSIMPAIETIRELTKQQADMAQYNKTIEDLQKTLDDMLLLGQREKVISLVNQTYYNASKIQDEVWRELYMKKIKDRYGAYLTIDSDQTKGVNLGGFIE
jgi:hypothetical protein